MVYIAAKTRLSTKSRCVLETGALCIKFAMTMTAIVTSADLWPQHNDSLSYSACWYSLYKRISYKQYTSTFNSSTFTSNKFKKKEGRTRRFTSEKWKPMHSMVRKLKNDPQSRALLRWGGVVENTMAGRHHWCPGWIPCSIQSKEEAGERERPRDRCKDLPKGRTLMVIMMNRFFKYEIISFRIIKWPS